MSGRGILRVLTILGGAFAVLLFGRSLYFAAHELAGHPAPFDPLRMIASLIVLVGTYFLTIAVWRSVILRFGAGLDYRAAVRLWSFSNLGRYLPGKIWQVVGIVTLGRPHGITPMRGGAIALVTLGLMIGTGAALGVFFLPSSVPEAESIRFVAIVGAVLLLLPVIQPRILEEVVRRVPRRFGGGEHVHAPGRAYLFAILVLFFAIWVLQGTAFFLLATSWVELPWSELPRLTGAYSLSYVAGLVAVFAPGGIGVREGVLALVLEPLASRGLPVQLSVVGSRLAGLLAEAVVLGVALALKPSEERSSRVEDLR